MANDLTEAKASQPYLKALRHPASLLLALILMSALVLRLWGFWFDLPELSHPDEVNEVHRALRLGMGNFEWDRISKGGFFYVLFVEYGIYFVVLKLAGIVSSPNEFMMLYVEDSSTFWALGRITACLLGTLNVYLTYRIGTVLAGRYVGLGAAAFLAFCSLDVMHSKFIGVDIPMTTCVLVTLLFSLRLFETGAIRYYLLAGAFAALATMTKLSAGPVVFSIAFAHFAHHHFTSRSLLAGIADKRLYLSAATFLALYALGQPAIVLMPFKVFDSATAVTAGEESQTVWKAEHPNLVMYYVRHTLAALGWPVALLSLLGVAYYGWRREWQTGILLVFLLLTYLFLFTTGSTWHNPRYLLPVLPLLCIFAAMLLFDLIQMMVSRPRPAAMAGIALVTLFCLPRMAVIARDNIDYSRPGTPALARQWMHDNAPEGAKILLMGSPGVRHERRLCPLQDTPENMLEFADRLEQESSMGARFVRLAAERQTGPAYDLTVRQADEPWPSLDEVKQSGVRYVIASPSYFTGHVTAAETGRQGFYQSLKRDPNVELRRRFVPDRYNEFDSVERDVVLEIYELRDERVARR